MKFPPVPPDDYEKEELAYVRSLVEEEIFVMEYYFQKKYPNGYPFIANEEDHKYLDAAEAGMRARLAEGREKYGWTDYEVSGYAATVRMSLLMRFKQTERTTNRLPDWNVFVEEILDAAPPKGTVPFRSANDERF
jgi:hypothetical protein